MLADMESRTGDHDTATPAPATDDQARAAQARIADALAQIGFVLPGTITERMRRCGKPNCRCAQDTTALHGPYIQWTRTVAGKTVTKQLSAEQWAATGPGSTTPASYASSSPASKPSLWARSIRPRGGGPKANPEVRNARINRSSLRLKGNTIKRQHAGPRPHPSQGRTLKKPSKHRRQSFGRASIRRSAVSHIGTHMIFTTLLR
ncbi:DUF6788 family protein [Brevibacterium spongiae]|uniref:DUF6788 family protein n=1 Tax=Brevibacterium spongiae TaxID=2909672 RepID=UPI003D253077